MVTAEDEAGRDLESLEGPENAAGMTEPLPSHDFSNEIDVIWHNMDMRSDFRTNRTGNYGDIKETLVKLGRKIEAGCFDKLISVTASKNSLVVVMETMLSRAELAERGMFS